MESSIPLLRSISMVGKTISRARHPSSDETLESILEAHCHFQAYVRGTVNLRKKKV